MVENRATCPLCGARFDPGNAEACSGCPVVRGCRLTCCPICHYSWVDPDQAAASRWLSRLWRQGLGGRRQIGEAAQRSPTTPGPTLADIPAGSRARIAAWRGSSSTRRQQLQAYGLSIGRMVRVVQQAGATVVLVEHTELALERDLARMIVVESPTRDGPGDFSG